MSSLTAKEKADLDYIERNKNNCQIVSSDLYLDYPISDDESEQEEQEEDSKSIESIECEDDSIKMKITKINYDDKKEKKLNKQLKKQMKQLNNKKNSRTIVVSPTSLASSDERLKIDKKDKVKNEESNNYGLIDISEKNRKKIEEKENDQLFEKLFSCLTDKNNDDEMIDINELTKDKDKNKTEDENDKYIESLFDFNEKEDEKEESLSPPVMLSKISISPLSFAGILSKNSESVSPTVSERSTTTPSPKVKIKSPSVVIKDIGNCSNVDKYSYNKNTYKRQMSKAEKKHYERNSEYLYGDCDIEDQYIGSGNY